MKDLHSPKSLKRIFFENFLAGSAWILGTIVGGAIFLSLLGFIGARVRAVPIVGKFVYDVIEEVQNQNK